MRNVIIRNTTLGEWMVVMIVGENNEEAIEGLMQALGDNFPQITSLVYGVNTKVNDTIYDVELVTVKGKDYIEEQLEDIIYSIRPKSFFKPIHHRP